MPKLREIDVNYDQIRDLVYQLEFEKKMALIKDVVKDKRYQNDFYRFTESLVQKYNIPEMDESELNVILEQAQLSEFISRLPDGIHTKIGEGNRDLSAGQRQLLAMARVLARNPQIFVLDEATANVDSETEILVERAVEATLAQRTSIVIAHRLSTIRRADRIIVMDSGRIVEEGTHENLIARKGFYHRLQNLQYIEWNQTKSVQPPTE